MEVAEELVPEFTEEPLALPLHANVLFAIPRAKTSTIPTPVGDGDNFEKAVFDMIQKKGYLEDDRWLTSATWKKRFLPHGSCGFTLIELEEALDDTDITEGCITEKGNTDLQWMYQVFSRCFSSSS